MADDKQVRDLTPLPILSGKLSYEDWVRIRKAKEELNLPFLVQPVPAVPGSPGRVLAIGKKPDWLCDGAYLENTESKGLKDALAYVLGEHSDPRAFTVLTMLQEILGPGVREVTDEYGPRGEHDPGLDNESPYRRWLAEQGLQ